MQPLGEEVYDYCGRAICVVLGQNVYRLTLDNLTSDEQLRKLRRLEIKAELDRLDFAFDFFRALCAKYHSDQGGLGFDTAPYNSRNATNLEYKKTAAPTLIGKGFWSTGNLPTLREKLVSGEQFGYVYVLGGNPAALSPLVLHMPLDSNGRKDGYVLRHGLTDTKENTLAYAKFLDDARSGRIKL